MNVTEITKIAVDVYNEYTNNTSNDEILLQAFHEIDPVLYEIQKRTIFFRYSSKINQNLKETVFADSVFNEIQVKEKENDIMLMTPLGGIRLNIDTVINGIFSAAFIKQLVFEQPDTQSNYVKNVIEGFEQLKLAMTKHQITGYEVSGLGGITLSTSKTVNTPWGIIKPIPNIDYRIKSHTFGKPETKCLMIQTKNIPVELSREANPTSSFEPVSNRDLVLLLPLSCVLASKDYLNPAIPVITWSTIFIPFISTFGYSVPFYNGYFKPEIQIDSQIEEFEDWARIVDKENMKEIELAITRVSSAIAYRNDATDALIDAVIAWENLLGAESEVTFRVTASLAKLIESNYEERMVLKRKLADIYKLRSKVIHGGTFNLSDINSASKIAIEIACKVLAISLKRGRDWISMKNSERSDKILLS